MWRAIVMTVLLVAKPMGASATESCPVEHARYTMMDGSKFSAGFRAIPKTPDWLSDVAFFVHSGETDRTFWFLFDAGSGRHIYMHSTTDATKPGWRPPAPDGGERPLGQMLYLAANADLAFSLKLPASEQPAPTYVLLPDLPDVMWYRVPEPRESTPLAFFKLTGCAS